LVALHAAHGHAGGPPFLVASEFTIGGGAHDRLTDLVVDAGGNAFVSGVIGSYNFPGVDSAAITNAGVDLRFVAKIPPLARTPSWVAVTGAPSASLSNARSAQFVRDEAAGLAIDPSGNAYVVAYDGSKDYPVSGEQYRGTTGRKYVFKVGPTGQVSRHSIALDLAVNRVAAIALDGSGAVYLTGSARDGLQTTVGAPYPTAAVAAGCIAPYVMKLDATGQSVVYATYLGNAGTQGHACGGAATNGVIDPTGFALAVDAGGNAYVTGQAEPGLPASAGAVDFGTKAPGSFYVDGNIVGTASHAFVAKINAAGTAILFSARLGGARPDRGTSLVVAADGAVIVAGKTSSPTFPTAGAGPQQGFPFVAMDCSLWTPEVGFVSKLSADGRQLLFSNFVPLQGGQLDDCGGRYGTLNFEPAKLAVDSAGNIFVAGYTVASNVDVPYSPDAIIPAPVGVEAEIGNQLLQVISADGRRLIYSSPLAPFGVQGLALDPWMNVVIAGDTRLERVASGRLPVELAAPRAPVCAGRSVTLSASVAGSNDAGTVEFQADGASLGSAAIANDVAIKAATLGTGIRRIKATYRGAGPFDGYASPDVILAVNQAGACP
jgi:hypothetical protein